MNSANDGGPRERGGFSGPFKENRQFGLLFAAIALALSVTSRMRQHVAPESLWIVAAVLGTVALLRPNILHPARQLWLWLGDVLHRAISPVLVAILFFLVLTPIATVVRAFRRESRAGRAMLVPDSYWIIRQPPGPAPASMKDQF